MPKIANKKFMPVNRSQAKEQIFRTIQHEPENTLPQCSKDPLTTINANGHFDKLNDPFFASKLDKKMNFSKMMYDNTNKKDKESLYDYQKIQSTA